MEDWQLLDTYARTGSEAAFAQLVERHLGLVHAAARRQVNDDALAADVAQAVFLLLARKAGSMGRKVVLAGWLFRTTRFVAARALRAELRLKRREQEAVAMQELHAPDPTWNQLAPELDEALAGLSESDRNALLLRYTEGRNHREVGKVLGITEEAAKKRVNRALDKLRVTLAHHGVLVSAGILAGFLADQLSAAPPSGLARAITQGSLTGAAQQGVAVELARQVVAAWRWTRVRTVASVAGVMALMLLAAGGVKSGWGSHGGTYTRGGTAAAGVMATTRGSSDPTRKPSAVTSESLRLQVLAADTGIPLPGARVPLNFVVDGQWLRPTDMETDAQGMCVIPLPRTGLFRVDAGAHFPGYEDRFLTWRKDWQFPRPESYTLRLARAETIGGQVVSAQGHPVPGVVVWLSYKLSDTSSREPEEDREREGFMWPIRLGSTDAEGRWICATIPKGRLHFAIEFEHPDFVRETSLSVNRENVTPEGRAVLAQLHARTRVTTLRDGYVATGRILNAAGEPVIGARIGTSWHGTGAMSDREGGFSMRSQPLGEVMFTATADGFAPKRFRAQAGGNPVEVRLGPSGVLRAQFVNAAGEPIVGARLVLEDGFEDGALGWDDRTDSEGRVVWRSAPPGRRFLFTAAAEGYQTTRSFPLEVDGTEHRLVLQPALTVVGSVVDQDSGQPVARFKAIPGRFNGGEDVDRSALRYGVNGQYELSFEESGAQVVRIEAEGYETEIGRPVPGFRGEPRCDFRLRHINASNQVRGRVLNPDGTPAAGAEVVLCTLDGGAMLGQSRFLRAQSHWMTNADSSGRFNFPLVRAPHTVVAVSRRGFGRASTLSNSAVEVRLEAFGGIEGVATRDGQPMAGQKVILLDSSYTDYKGAVSLEVATFEQQCDESGRFRLNAVPPGDYQMYVYPGVGIPWTDEAKVRVISGQISTVQIGEPDPAGRTVLGQLKPSEPLRVRNWKSLVTQHHLGRILPPVKPPSGLNEQARQLWLVAWHQSEAGREWARQKGTYTLDVDADGRFVGRGVPPGEYQLCVSALPEEFVRKEIWAQRGAPWKGFTLQNITIPDGPPGQDATPVDLGFVELKIQRSQ